MVEKNGCVGNRSLVDGATAFTVTGGIVMARARRRGSSVTATAIRSLVLLFGSLALALCVCGVRADVIMLRGGGQVQGKVVADAKDNDRVQVWLPRGKKPLSFHKQQILEVIPQASPLDGYVLKRDKAAGTAQAQYDLGAWCDQNKLSDLARLHYEEAVHVDKSFGPAQVKLGRVFHDGAWLTKDELSAVQGLVKYKGRWITSDEKAKHDVADKSTAAQASWLSRIKMLRQAVVNGPADRRREAESQLMSIRDADAVGPLVRVFGNDDRPQRMLLAHVLATISGPVATAALVKQLLVEGDNDVRALVLEKLRERDEPGIVPRLIQALRANDLNVINRAAWALGNLNAVEAVPKLIPVLVSTDTQLVMVSPDEGAAPSTPMVPVGISKNGQNVAVMNGPVVGPGVAAYGATVVPYGAFANSLQGPRPPEPAVAVYAYKNVEVLNALAKLTGQDFGFDAEAWLNWLSRSNPNPKRARKVPQP